MTRFIFIIFFILPGPIYSHSIYFGFMSGTANYSLTELRTSQDFYLSRSRNFIPNVVKVAEFPNYYNHQGFMEIGLGDHAFGFDLTRYSSGAKNSVSDYSGYYRLNMLLAGYRYGLRYRYIFAKTAPLLQFYSQVNLGMISSVLKFDEEIVIYNVDSETFSEKFTGNGFFIEGGLGVELRIFKLLYFNINGGYEQDFPKELVHSNPKIKLYPLSHKGVVADWSGFRLQGGFIIKLNK